MLLTISNRKKTCHKLLSFFMSAFARKTADLLPLHRIVEYAMTITWNDYILVLVRVSVARRQDFFCVLDDRSIAFDC